VSRPVRSRARGATLLEILIALAVVLLGVMGLFRVLSAASRGSTSAQQFTQASARARQILEATRMASATVLGCLAATPATQWATCEALCRQELGSQASPESCVFVTLSASHQATDRSLQAYQVVSDAADLTRSSWVRAAGTTGRVYDIQITLGWNDNGAAAPVQHRVTLRSAVFR
jgi:Tfp pilus assembly protein PilV